MKVKFTVKMGDETRSEVVEYTDDEVKCMQPHLKWILQKDAETFAQFHVSAEFEILNQGSEAPDCDQREQ